MRKVARRKSGNAQSVAPQIFILVQCLIPALLAGGNWNNGASCSSQARNANNARSNANTNIGSQGRRHGASKLHGWTLYLVESRKADGKTQRGEAPPLVVYRNRGCLFLRMRRHGNLWQRIITEDNLRDAYQKAALHKNAMTSVQKFKKDIDNNIQKIRQSLVDKTFRTSPYAEKIIYEPKQRIIYVLPFAPDRIVQHALMNVVTPIWDSMFIKDSFACREGKGIHSGSERTMQFVRRNKYCLKCDISKFYPSINHEILIDIVNHKIKDPDVLWLIDEIVHSFPGEKNVPIGNYTSQWFGNLYLNELDQFVKTRLHVKDYIRYCDDFLLFNDNKKYLSECAVAMRDFLEERLKLRFSKCDLFPVKHGVDFLGYRHFDNYILLRKNTTKRVRKRMEKLPKLYAEGKITAEQYRSSVGSTWGWLKHANTHNLVVAMRLKELLKEVRKLA
jgi:retron-type reverse transcriptase